jgi:hypothetical protein
LNNSNSRNLVTGYLQNPPEDPRGFINSTYSAAEIETPNDKLSVKGSNQEAYVSSTIGGSVSSVSFKPSKPRNRTGSTRAGGTRGKIKKFSRVSRRNLLTKLASINRTAFRAFKGRLLFASLTYPTDYPEDPALCKRNLEAFRKRLEREFGKFAGFWRMGIQHRGAFHFHVLLFMPSSTGSTGSTFIGSLREIRQFIATSWYKICGEVSEGHLLAGTNVEEIRAWKRATSCVEKYMAKEEVFPEGIETGRIWAVWNEKLLPIQWEIVKVSLKDAFRIRRVYRKLVRRKGSGSLCRMTVFIRYENVVRLLEYLGYCLE